MAKNSKKRNSKEKSQKNGKSIKKIESIKRAEKKKTSLLSKRQQEKGRKRLILKNSNNITSKLINKNEKSNTKLNEINTIESKQTDLKIIDNTKSELNNKIKKYKNNLMNLDNAVQLKSSDYETFFVPADLLKKVKLISSLIEDAIEDNESILLNEVDSKNLELVLEYLEHYKNDEPKEIPKPFPERTDDEFLRSIVNDEWTFDFLQKLSIEDAINLVNSSHYLQINGLIDLLAAKLAHEMCNCDVEEARKKFGIECDMTEEEIAEIDKYPLD